MKLTVEKRKEVRRGTRRLRNEGTLPGVIYGPKRKSLNIKIDLGVFKKLFREAGQNRVIDLQIGSGKSSQKVLVREVQYDPVSDKLVHVSFFEMDVTKLITVKIPLKTKGVSKSVEEHTGFLAMPSAFLEVRCLPGKLPENLVIDISRLEAVGDSIAVSQLKLPEGVELGTRVTGSATLAYIAPPQKEIVEEEKVSEEIEEEEEDGEEVVEEGETAEGEETEKQDEKKEDNEKFAKK